MSHFWHAPSIFSLWNTCKQATRRLTRLVNHPWPQNRLAGVSPKAPLWPVRWRCNWCLCAAATNTVEIFCVDCTRHDSKVHRMVWRSARSPGRPCAGWRNVQSTQSRACAGSTATQPTQCERRKRISHTGTQFEQCNDVLLINWQKLPVKMTFYEQKLQASK